MQRFQDPLIIFHAFAARDAFERGLGLNKQQTDPTEIDTGDPMNPPHLIHMYNYRSLHGTTCSLYINVCRATGGHAGFLRRAASLYSCFDGPVFVFHRELPGFVAPSPSNVFINFDMQSLLDVLRISGVSQEERARMASFVGAAPAPAPSGAGAGAGGRGRRTQLFNETAPPETLSGMHLNLENNPEEEEVGRLLHPRGEEELAIALRLSEEEYARSLSAKKPAQPNLSWQSILKPPEKAEPGQPQCNVCFENRASICFPVCGHQCICDACVQQLVAHECVVCRAKFEAIVRPIVSLWTPPAPAGPGESTARGGAGDQKRRKVDTGASAPPAPAKRGREGRGNKKEK